MGAALFPVSRLSGDASGSLARTSAGGPGPRGRRRPWLRLVPLVALGSLLFSGCYTYVPSDAARLDPGSQLEFELNDQGRVAMDERLGPEVATVDGTLVAVTDSQYGVRVARVRYLDGTSSAWGGEKVDLQQQYVKRVLERKFSKGRTLVAIGSGAAAIGAFIATRSLIGNGTGNQTTKPGGGPGNGQ